MPKPSQMNITEMSFLFSVMGAPSCLLIHILHHCINTFLLDSFTGRESYEYKKRKT